MKIPKIILIILILTVVTVLFIGCDNPYPLEQEELDKIAAAAMFSSFFPVAIITEELEKGENRAFDLDDFEGIIISNIPAKVTWENFDIKKADDVFELIVGNNEVAILRTFLAEANGLDENQLVIISGSADVTANGANRTVVASFTLKINVSNPDIPKGEFDIKYTLDIENDVPKSIDIKVNNIQANFSFVN